MKKLFGLLIAMLALAACYSPEPFEAEDSGESAVSGQSSKIGKMFHVNGMEQVCNPSVSQDAEKYPASMLWLNFGGTLRVNAPDSVYTTKRVKQHDRLTVSDTAGDVKWYMMVGKDECQFQDPEWSTHGGFIVALRGNAFKDGKLNCGGALDYKIFAVRMADQKKFWFFDKNSLETASPHLWVKKSARPDTSAPDSTVEGFFGTKDVRLVYVDSIDATEKIVFVDFANGGEKKTLKKPAGKEKWGVDAPMISPDGKFIVYNVLENPSTWEAYIQELSANSMPIKIEEVKGMLSAPAQPHWFEFNGRLFVLWAEFAAREGMLNKSTDLTEESVQDGSFGRTVMREIRLAANAPSDLAFEWVDEMREVAPVPMIGGRSPDGMFLATGTNPAYLLKLP